MKYKWLAPIKDEKFESILGQELVKSGIKSALISGRNIILVGPPGVGKTTLAKSIAKKISAPFVRVQGSPDLSAEDLIGDIDPLKAMKYGPLSKEAFTPGKIFKADKGILFFDEVNRCSEKLQNALLQALEEKSVTIGTYNVDMPADFVFIGTMNPEDSSTEKLSDVFLDRFDLVEVTHPEKEEYEAKILDIHGQELIEVPASIKDYIVGFIHRLRNDEKLEKKPSVRASLGLYDRSQAHAIVEGRKKVTMNDLNAIVASVLAHRIRLKPSVKYLQSAEDYIKKEFQTFTKEASVNEDP